MLRSRAGKEREIIVEIDHGRLKAYGLSIEEIADSLKANNMNVQVGSVVSGSYRLTARAEGGYGDLSQIETMGIRSTSSGSVVPLKELGRVSDAFRREENRTRFQGEPRVVLYVQKESGANVIRISEELRRELDRLQDELPKELKLEVIYDQADYIQASIKRLRDEALIGAGLAMIVIFLFLRNLPSVFVIGAAIPVSIIATFTMMHLFGITLNIISLSGLRWAWACWWTMPLWSWRTFPRKGCCSVTEPERHSWAPGK